MLWWVDKQNGGSYQHNSEVNNFNDDKDDDQDDDLLINNEQDCMFICLLLSSVALTFNTISGYFVTGYAFTRLPKSPYAYVILPTL